jgi:hypothetical protein
MTSVPDVIAFLSGLDKTHTTLIEGTAHRFAVLTWFDRDGSACAPWPLLKPAFPRIAELLNAYTITAEYHESKPTRWLGSRRPPAVVASVSWTALAACSDAELHENSFPTRFRFACQGATLAIAESEPWAMVGGPAPYHDSVTLSFYTSIDVSAPLRTIFSDAALTLGISIRHFCHRSSSCQPNDGREDPKQFAKATPGPGLKAASLPRKNSLFPQANHIDLLQSFYIFPIANLGEP